MNLEVYEGEYFPLTFFCSSWIKEVIQNGSIGNLSFPGASPSFADMLPYLHKMLEYLKEREESEKDMLIKAGGEAFISEHSDWDAALCEWKIANNIHNLSPTRAKKFHEYKEMQKKSSQKCADNELKVGDEVDVSLFNIKPFKAWVTNIDSESETVTCMRTDGSHTAYVHPSKVSRTGRFSEEIAKIFTKQEE